MNDAAELIDYQHLEKYVAGDAGLRDEILSIFSEQLTAIIEQFDVLQHDADWKDTAHTLKGAARGVGAWALGDLGAKAELFVGDAPAKAESRAAVLVSIRHLAREVLAEIKRERAVSWRVEPLSA